jgi:carboxypeptidase C (cathepsin A)
MVSVMCWRHLRHLVLGVAVVFLAAACGAAQPTWDAPSGEHRAQPSGVLSLLPADSITEHAVDTGDERLTYTARAGTLALLDQSGERSAAIFYTAYTLKDVAAKNRPVTFVFNGGPGASAAYLHLGLVGPHIVEFGPRPDGAGAQLRKNPDTWLRFIDLVLIDPVGTGWSRAAAPDNADTFWSVEAQ